MNPGATVPIWPQPTAWKHEAYFDKPDMLSLDIAGDHGMADRAVIEAYLKSEEEGDSFSDIVFRGFVIPPDESGSDVVKVSVPSIERMFDHLFTQTSRYPAGLTLTRILTSDWPTDGYPAGIICQLNNRVPQGLFRLLSGNVWKLTQGGTSFLGSLHSKGDHVYINSTQQTWGSSTTLSAGQYWQDADYLYIRVPDSSKNPYNYLILAEGAYETNIRIGTITGGTATFSRSVRIGNSQGSREITRWLKAAGLELQYDYNADGYTYLNASAAIGRGANTAQYPTYKYDECEIKKVKRNTSGGAVPCHTIIGLGIGKGASRQAYSEASFPLGLRFCTQEEQSNLFEDQLEGWIGKLYDDRQDVTAWKIITEDDPSTRPGDWIKIVPEFEGARIERIKQISRSSDGPMTIYAGQRIEDLDDKIRAKLDIRDQQQRDLDLQYTAISASGQENVDSSNPCNIILKVDQENWDSEIDSSWLLSVNVSAFESSLTDVSTPASNHGAAGSTTYTGAAGSHDDHDLENVETDDAAASGYHAYIYSETSSEDGDGYHYHAVDEGWEYLVSLQAHYHGHASDTYPGSADDHNDHYLDQNPEQDADMFSGVMKALAAGGTSSWVAYLTVVIKVINSTYPSGQTVPGSPFYDIAIGEDISDIDVAGLFIPGENTVQISISRYDTVLPGQTSFVKARANVSLSGKLVVDTYYS